MNGKEDITQEMLPDPDLLDKDHQKHLSRQRRRGKGTTLPDIEPLGIDKSIQAKSSGNCALVELCWQKDELQSRLTNH